MNHLPDRVFVAIIVILLSMSGIIAPVGAAPAMSASTADIGAGTLSVTQEESPTEVAAAQPAADSTVTRIAVHENGSATWELSVRTRLDTEQRVQEYKEFQTQFRDDRDARIEEFGDRMSGVVENAAATTGREMTTTEFDARTSIQEFPRRWGVVTYSFRWDGFAQRDDGDVLVGDVFAGGFYLDTDDALIFEPPAGYEHTAVEPSPEEVDGDELVWRGREDFADRTPSVRLTPTDDGTTPQGTSSDGLGDAGVIVFVGVVFVAALVLLYRQRGSVRAVLERFERAQAEDSPSSPDEGQTADSPPDTSPGSEASATGELSASVAATTIPVTDEDRVRTLLADNDRRLKQSAIAAQLEWSDSKTSRVLSSMADEGTVEKLRIGRENVIDLADRDSGDAE